MIFIPFVLFIARQFLAISMLVSTFINASTILLLIIVIYIWGKYLPFIKLFTVYNNYVTLIKIFTVEKNHLPLIKSFSVSVNNNCLLLIEIFPVNKIFYP